MELDQPEDPKNHKHKLNEAIIEVLSSASPSKKLKSLYVFFLVLIYLLTHLSS